MVKLNHGLNIYIQVLNFYLSNIFKYFLIWQVLHFILFFLEYFSESVNLIK